MIYQLSNIIDLSSERYPEKIAFKCGKQSITYSEISQKTNQLANVLIENGIKKGDRVGILMNRCLETSIAIYGIMKSGGAYVPIDFSAPAERIKFQLEDCGINHLITTQKHRKKISEVENIGCQIQYIIGLEDSNNSISWEKVYTSIKSPPKVNILANDLAYIMYTSGSTGTPKGIMHTHYSGLSYAQLSADLYNITEEDIVGNHAPIHFDISTLGYFTAPLVGATTSIVPEAYTKMPASLAQLVADHKMTIWYSVPLALIQMEQQNAIMSNDFSNLRWILFGGEVFPIRHLKVIMNHLPSTHFSNVYGPAEVNQCTFFHISSVPNSDEPLSLGEIWKNSEGLILDESDQIADAGELVVRSATMMEGYWNQPELTAKAFFIQQSKEGFTKKYYRTGDLVKRNQHGNLEFVGRKDRQIKVRGYRVELEEVTNSILKMAEVEEVAVYPVVKDEITQIHSQIILKKQVLEDRIRAFLDKLIPKYAHPAQIKFVEDFPRTPSGKVDIKKLQIEDQKKIDGRKNN